MQINTLAQGNNDSELGPAPLTDLCKRVLFRQNECQICADICPTDAISFALGPVINENCINCGLCNVACPTQAFGDFYDTEQMLLEMIQQQAEQTVKDHRLYVHCHQAEADNPQSISVNCLGNMTENALVAMAGNGVEQLLLSTGDCNSCQLCKGMDLFKQALQVYTDLSNIMPSSSGVALIPIHKRTKQKQPKSAGSASRREFFRSLGKGVARQVAKAVVEKEQRIRALLQSDETLTVQKRASPRRETLKSLLIEHVQGESRETDDSQLPWKKMHVDVANCVGCGICVNVCPTGALVKEIQGLELTRTINYSLCINCGLCAEACPQNVIDFDVAYSLSDIVNNSEEVVARVSLNSCQICGEIIPASEGEVCTTCQKRQVMPMFMK